MTWCNKFGIHYLFDNILILLLSILISCILLYEHYCLHLLHYTWLKCIRSYTKDLNYEFFFANRWLFHNWFISLDNPLEVIVHHLLIGWMAGFGNQDGFPMVSALLCIVTHWIGTTVIHDLRLSSSHDLTKLLYCAIFQAWGNIEVVLKLAMTLTCGWDHKLIIFSVWIGSLLMEVSSNRYTQSRHYDIYLDWDSVSLWVILRRCVHGNYDHSSSLSGTWHRLFDS